MSEYALKSEFIRAFNALYGKAESTETSVTGGFPDILYHKIASGGSTGVIETKYGEIRKNGLIWVGIEADQIVWHITWNKVGLKAWILLRLKDRRSDALRHALVRTTEIDWLTKMRKTELQWDELESRSIWVGGGKLKMDDVVIFL